MDIIGGYKVKYFILILLTLSLKVGLSQNTLICDQHKKIINASNQFLGTPYQFDSLKDQKYSHPSKIISLDCLTFIQTVLALSHTHHDFADKLNQARYLKKPYNYMNRIHFTHLDLNTHYQKLGWIKPPGTNFCPLKHSSTLIKLKQFWTQKLIQKGFKSSIDKDLFLQSLPESKKSSIHYIPKEKLVHNNDIHHDYLPCLQPVMLVEFIHENWHPKGLNTPLQTSHLGLLIKQKNRWILRHASLKKGVIDQDFVEYIMNKKSSTFIGVSLWNLT